MKQMTLRETERAIKLIKDTFEMKLAQTLNLQRVSAPLFVRSNSGLNDNLSGIERVVSFDIKNINNEQAEVVQSLAKWKRMALAQYEFNEGEGLYTDMNAIRRDDDVDCIHSVYVDQWDWERVVSPQDRNLNFLKNIVSKIVEAISDTNDVVNFAYPDLLVKLTKKVFFVTTQQLEDMYPDLTPKQRELEITRLHKTVFIMQIGDKLKSGLKHDGRAPDYDDWQLNGDIMFWHEALSIAMELSSMGIRVDGKALMQQLEKAESLQRQHLPFHSLLLQNKLPLTIGGGIGQSRLCMLMLGKKHIGEVQVSLWSDEEKERCKKENIVLL